jgi:hypothetical protein
MLRLIKSDFVSSLINCGFPGGKTMNGSTIAWGVMVALVSAWVIVNWWLGNTVTISAENGWLELIQFLILVGTAITFYAAFRATQGRWRVSAGLLTIGAAAAGLREFDFDMFDPLSWLGWVHQNQLHWIGLALLLSPILLSVVREARLIPAAMLLALRLESWPFLVGCALIGAAMIAENMMAREAAAALAAGAAVLENAEDLDHILEEFLETLGYAFLLLASLRHASVAATDDEALQSNRKVIQPTSLLA